jgi:hypothetical protein
MQGEMHWHACKTTCVRKRISQVCISWAYAIKGGQLLAQEKGRQGGLPQAHRRAKLTHDKQANFGPAQQAEKEACHKAHWTAGNALARAQKASPSRQTSL